MPATGNKYKCSIANIQFGIMGKLAWYLPQGNLIKAVGIKLYSMISDMGRLETDNLYLWSSGTK